MYRHPIETTASLARMVYFDAKWDPYKMETSVKTWVRHNFWRSCVIHNIRYCLVKNIDAKIYLFDFSYFMKNQEEFIDLMCDKLDIKKPNRILSVGNINPKSSWLQKNKYWSKELEEGMRDYLFTHMQRYEDLKLELSVANSIQSKKFAVIDKTTFPDLDNERSGTFFIR